MKLVSSNMQVMITTFLSICLLFISLVSTKGAEVETTFGYVPGAANGPERWALLNPNWTICGTGQEQSPIDITDQRIETQPNLGKLSQSYQPAQATLKNRGIFIELSWDEDAGSITINGTRYDVVQLHWHSPSEHTINGQRYDLEVHIVHQSTDNRIAVVGVLYTNGLPDPLITRLEPAIRNISNVEGKEQPIGLADPREAQGINIRYYRYMGSLTTPPCTEGVVWTILEKVRTVSTEQVNLLKQALPEEFINNARPIQNINDRSIAFYQPQKVRI